MTTPAPTASAITDEQIDAYLNAQRKTVEEADRFGRPNVGGLHTNTVREACRNGLAAVLALQPAMSGATPAGFVLIEADGTTRLPVFAEKEHALTALAYATCSFSDLSPPWLKNLSTGLRVLHDGSEVAATAAPIEAAQPASSSAPAVGAQILALRETQAVLEMEDVYPDLLATVKAALAAQGDGGTTA